MIPAIKIQVDNNWTGKLLLFIPENCTPTEITTSIKPIIKPFTKCEVIFVTSMIVDFMGSNVLGLY